MTNAVVLEKVVVGQGAPITGDQITADTSQYPINTPYIDKTNGAQYVRTATNKLTGDWTQIGSGDSGYLVYIPTMAQNGTGELSVVEFANSTGQTITWARSEAGVYSASLTFDSIHVDGFGNWGNGNPFGVIADGGEVIGYYTIYWGTTDISFEVFDAAFAHADLSTLLGNDKVFSFPTVKIKNG